MQTTNRGRRSRSPAAIRAEAASVEKMMAGITKRIDASDRELKTSTHLQVRRAELRAYWAGLLYSVGYTDLLDGKVGQPDVEDLKGKSTPNIH